MINVMKKKVGLKVIKIVFPNETIGCIIDLTLYPFQSKNKKYFKNVLKTI